MKAVNNIINAVIFMEENLNKQISSEQIAFYSTYSVHHFSRVFISLTGMSPGEYLRRRRLTLAAIEILYNGKKILNTAFEYQFQTQEGFTRAFRDYFGITPGRCRQSGKDISARFMGVFSEEKIIKLQSRIIIKPKIVDLGELKFVGINIFTKDKKEIREVWHMFMRYEDKIKNRNELNYRNRYGLEFYTEEFFDSGKFFYMPAVLVDSLVDIPLEMTAKIFPQSKYAIFTHKGSADKISDSISMAYDSGLAEAGLEKDGFFDFEFYDQRFVPDSVTSEIDIYIPVK